MKKLFILLLALCMLLSVPCAACAESTAAPAVILPEETKQKTDMEERPLIALQKTENNYNHRVLLDDENCLVAISDADLDPEEGWTITVKCENRRDEMLTFTWENTAVTADGEDVVWAEEISVSPETWQKLSFAVSEIPEAESMQIGFTVSCLKEEEPEAAAKDRPEENTLLPETEPDENIHPGAEETEAAEPEILAEVQALMKTANGHLYVLDDATSPIIVDFEVLTARNSDICGWLYCPDTVISYPVVQAEDNSFYLHRDIDLNYSSYGTLFTEAMSARDFDNDNSIIYGHHMKDGGMFALLVNYAKKDFYEKHPVFYLNTPEMNYRVEVFAAFLTDMYSDAYNNSFDSDEEMQAWLDAAKEQSAIETDVEVVPGDRVLTLSTCTYEYDTARYVVMGKMIPIR